MQCLPPSIPSFDTFDHTTNNQAIDILNDWSIPLRFIISTKTSNRQAIYFQCSKGHQYRTDRAPVARERRAWNQCTNYEFKGVLQLSQDSQWKVRIIDSNHNHPRVHMTTAIIARRRELRILAPFITAQSEQGIANRVILSGIRQLAEQRDEESVLRPKDIANLSSKTKM